ncbi:MAG: (Fe-S)-binding protein [Chloroflexi bacterium]|nr:(Fe-S)-binding protein [Chloroflexota bacterium]
MGRLSKEQQYAESLRCIRCGLCQAQCPVFDVLRLEPGVARGKVQLARALWEGKLGPSTPLREMVHQCLSCEACTDNCPSGVKVGTLLLEARAALVEELGLPAVESLILRQTLPYPSRLRLSGMALALYQRTGLRWLAHKAGLLQILPGELDEKEERLPETSFLSARQVLPTLSGPNPGRRVAYFLGCATDLFYPRLGRAMVEVLRQHGCQVFIPPQTVCCGMPHRASGDVATAARLEKQNTTILNEAEVEAIVVDCATCGSTLKGYDGLRAPVYDITEYLVSVIGLDSPASSLPSLTVTYHDPCHLKRGQGVSEAPRQVLRSIPGVNLVEMDEADRCCGGAGTFSLAYHDLSVRILERKMDNVAATEADILATGCPSCRMQLSYGLKREARRKAPRKLPRRVIHPIELLAEVYASGN